MIKQIYCFKYLGKVYDTTWESMVQPYYIGKYYIQINNANEKTTNMIDDFINSYKVENFCDKCGYKVRPKLYGFPIDKFKEFCDKNNLKFEKIVPKCKCCGQPIELDNIIKEYILD